jgi:hypothetical protein
MTNRDSIRLLCKSIVTRLENRKSISLSPRLRQVVQDELFGLVGPYILAESDIRDKALAKIGARSDLVESGQFTESDAYRAAKAVVKGSLGEHELNGFFFQKPVKNVAEMIGEYFMRSSHIDDVYETDDDLQMQIVEVVQKFKLEELH